MSFFSKFIAFTLCRSRIFIWGLCRFLFKPPLRLKEPPTHTFPWEPSYWIHISNFYVPGVSVPTMLAQDQEYVLDIPATFSEWIQGSSCSCIFSELYTYSRKTMSGSQRIFTNVPSSGSHISRDIIHMPSTPTEASGFINPPTWPGGQLAFIPYHIPNVQASPQKCSLMDTGTNRLLEKKSGEGTGAALSPYPGSLAQAHCSNELPISNINNVKSRLQTPNISQTKE